MKSKKMKKLLMSLTSAVTIATSVAMIVSCSDEKPSTKQPEQSGSSNQTQDPGQSKQDDKKPGTSSTTNSSPSTEEKTNVQIVRGKNGEILELILEENVKPEETDPTQITYFITRHQTTEAGKLVVQIKVPKIIKGDLELRLFKWNANWTNSETEKEKFSTAPVMGKKLDDGLTYLFEFTKSINNENITNEDRFIVSSLVNIDEGKRTEIGNGMFQDFGRKLKIPQDPIFVQTLTPVTLLFKDPEGSKVKAILTVDKPAEEDTLFEIKIVSQQGDQGWDLRTSKVTLSQGAKEAEIEFDFKGEIPNGLWKLQSITRGYEDAPNILYTMTGSKLKKLLSSAKWEYPKSNSN